MSSALSLPPEVAPLFASLELSPDPVFGTSRLNRIVFWNRSAERLLGYSAAEAIGTPCGGLLLGCDVHGNRYCAESCPVTQIAVRGEPVRHFELQLRAKDGRRIGAEVSILHLEAPPPDLFFLAHLLQLQDAQPPSPGLAEAGDAPPRPALDAARDSLDARARKLTSREVEILGMLAAGHTTPDMAARLHISRLTARNHLQNILDKLEVHSKSEAVAFAFQKRLV
jgi:PAS domain S-box-containing protein